MEEESIRLLKEGDIRTWHGLYRKYWGRVRCFISRMVPDAWAVDEIAQNVFVKIWNNRSRIVPEKGKDGSLSGYIFMITRNEVMDWYRHRIPVPVIRRDRSGFHDN